jgi:imidazolonepropionase-like amidohydrolase
MIRLCAAVALIGVPLGIVQAPSNQPSLVVRDITVINGAERPRPHAAIVVRDGRIAAISDAAAAPRGEVELDGTGLFAIPGLIDAHVHVSGAPWAEEVAALGRAVEGGVTSVFDVAGDTRETGALARAALAGDITAPSVYYVALFAGPDFFTDPRVREASLGFTPGEAPWAQVATPTTDVRMAIAEARGTGAIGIKLYAALDSDAVHRLTAEAHRQHLKVVAHATTFPAKPGDLVDAGVDILAHAAYLVWEGSAPSTRWQDRARGDFAHVPPDAPAITSLLEAMRAHGTALNPTLWIFSHLLPKEAMTDARTVWMNAVTKRAASMGIPIVAGTDSLTEPRDELPTLHRELEALVGGAGLTPAQALDSATRVTARVIGIDADRGALEPGRAADIVVLGANPLDDIRNTRQIRYVIKDGRLVPRGAR